MYNLAEMVDIVNEISMEKDKFYRDYRRIMRHYKLNTSKAIKDGTIQLYESLVVIRNLLHEEQISDIPEQKFRERAMLVGDQCLREWFRRYSEDQEIGSFELLDKLA